MKLLVMYWGIVFISWFHHGRTGIQVPTMEQLDSLYKNQWNLPQYDSARSGEQSFYLTEAEKKVIYYLNLARLDPKLFADTYANGYEGSICCSNNAAFDENEKLLISYLQALKPMRVLRPDSTIYTYADCQATALGQKGIFKNGHSRDSTGCKSIPGYGENIDYGQHTPLDVVMMWLNESINLNGSNHFGHRLNCLNREFARVGVACRHHSVRQQCVVVDFGYPVK